MKHRPWCDGVATSRWPPRPPPQGPRQQSSARSPRINGSVLLALKIRRVAHPRHRHASALDRPNSARARRFLPPRSRRVPEPKRARAVAFHAAADVSRETADVKRPRSHSTRPRCGRAPADGTQCSTLCRPDFQLAASCTFDERATQGLDPATRGARDTTSSPYRYGRPSNQSAPCGSDPELTRPHLSLA